MSTFFNKEIKDTYQRVLQIDGGVIQDGLGQTVNGSITSLTGSFQGDLAGTASYALSASVEITKEISSSHANFADLAGGLTGNPSINVSGITSTNNVTITGSLVVSGSTPTTVRFGNSFVFSNPTASITFSGSMTVTGSSQVNGNMGITGSVTISGSGTVITSTQTGSFQQTGSSATTGSNNFSGSQTVNGSVTITGSLTISGSDTLTNIGPFNQTGITTFTGNITASNDISASGNIIGELTGIGGAVTGISSILKSELILGVDTENKIDFEDAAKINFTVNGAKEVVLAENSLSPGTSDGTALGTTALQWSDLFLAEGGIINFDNGDVRIVQAAKNLNFRQGGTGTSSFDGRINVVGGISSSGNIIGELTGIGGAVTGITSLLATDIKIGEDNETKIDFEDANKINFYANNAKEVELAENSLSPGANDGTALGTTSLQWSDLFLAEGGVINFDNGDVTITQTGNNVTIAGGSVSASGDLGAGGVISGDGSGLLKLQRPIETVGMVDLPFTASATTAGKYFRTSGNATCSLVLNATASCPIGSEFEFIQTSSAGGGFLFTTSSLGITLNSKGGNVKLSGQFSGATLKKVGDNEWDLIGDLG